MSVAILLISHGHIGGALLNAVKQALGGELPLPVATVELESDADPDVLIPKLKKVVTAMNQGGGVLVLTDLFGSTPSNIANSLQDCFDIRIVTGLNLPMLIRVMNYPKLALAQLAETAQVGGQCGIIKCSHIKS